MTQPIFFAIRHRRVVALFVVAIVCLLVPWPFLRRSGIALADILHAPSFAVLTAVLFHATRSVGRVPSVVRAILVWLLMFSFGVTMEVVQSYVGRAGSLHDALANGTGAMAGILGVAAWQMQPGLRRKAIAASALFALFLGTLNPGLVLCDVAIAHVTFPRLADFEQPLEMGRWRANRTTLTRRVDRGPNGARGTWAMQVQIPAGRFSAAVLTPPARDWSDYRKLVFDIRRVPEGTHSDAIDQEPLDLFVKVQDDQHNHRRDDRFQYPFQPTETWQEIRISLADVERAPIGRSMDMAHIRLIAIVAEGPDRPQTIVIDNLRLE